MKKTTAVLAAILAATMSIGGMTAYAAETSEGSERPAFSENAGVPKADFKFGSIRNAEGFGQFKLSEEEKEAMIEKIKASLAEKLTAGKITQEEYDAAIAKIESGDFRLCGKGFKPKNDTGSFKFGKAAFDGKGFQDIKNKLSELTEEERAAMMEKFKENRGANAPRIKPAPFSAK